MTAADAGPGVEPEPDDVVDLGRWLVARWLEDRRRASLAMPRLQHPPASLDRTGAGVRVALLAGPVDRSHPDLMPARLRCRPSARPQSASRHATALASVLVGQGRRDVLGLVPEAELLVAPVQTAGSHSDGSDDVIARALRWAVGEGAQVVVLPFGRRRLGRRLAVMVRSVAEAGVRVFAAAGDLGPDVLTFPASVSGTVAVTAYDDAGVLPGCSRWADLAAPGRDVPAAGDDGPVALSGSSAAAVLAAGAWAALLSDAVGRDERRAAHHGRLVRL